MVDATIRLDGSQWFGVAWSGRSFVATAVGTSPEETRRLLLHCLPRDVELRETDAPSEFATHAVHMLAQLEAGDESQKRFSLSSDHLSAPLFRIYSAAAAIPIGYVSTYGTVAKTARSEARAVGRAMATNPLYPIVPCHRVVGADFSMVGYGGRQDEEALHAKLARLQAEARGIVDARDIPVGDRLLTVYPVEWVLNATREADERRRRELELEAERREAEALQLSLF